MIIHDQLRTFHSIKMDEIKIDLSTRRMKVIHYDGTSCLTHWDLMR